MELNKARIILLTLILEGILVGVFLVWAGIREFQFDICPDAAEVFWGLVLTLPLCVFSYILFGPFSHKVQVLEPCFKFKQEIIRPLAKEVDISAAVVISICAGMGEELFFRGVLQTEFGIIIASFLFSLLHFGPAVREHKAVAGIYVLIGFYLGAVFEVFGTLWVPIIVHAAYDFVALLYMRYADQIT